MNNNMVDSTLSIINILTATASVIVTLIVTENYYEKPQQQCQQVEMENGTKTCSPTDVIIAQITDELRNHRIAEAITLWKGLEANMEHKNNSHILKHGLSTILKANQQSPFQSVILPWIKHVNLHIRLTGYETILNNLVMTRQQHQKESKLKNDMTPLLLFANFLKSDWLSHKKILDQKERTLFVSIMKNEKIPVQMRKLIFSSSMALWSGGPVDGYLYATGNKAFFLDPGKRAVFLWTSKGHWSHPGIVAREGAWQINYEENTNSYLITSKHWQENLYSVCRNHDNASNTNEAKENSNNIQHNVFTSKEEFGEAFNCLSRWSIVYRHQDANGDDDELESVSSTRIFLTNKHNNKQYETVNNYYNSPIFSLSLDKNQRMTSNNNNNNNNYYRTSIFTEAHVNLTAATSSDILDEWEIVPLTYIF